MQRGVNVIILNEKGEMFLTKREDFEIWSLPGGGVEENELVIDAAKREIKEETGLDIEILDLVSVNYKRKWLNGGNENFVFTARIIGGELKMKPDEVIDAGWFGLDDIPEDIVATNKLKIDVFKNGQKGQIVEENFEWPFDENMTRKELYKLRDDSGLSRKDFYNKYFNS